MPAIHSGSSFLLYYLYLLIFSQLLIGCNSFYAENEHESFQAKLSKISKSTKFKNLTVKI